MSSLIYDRDHANHSYKAPAKTTSKKQPTSSAYGVRKGGSSYSVHDTSLSSTRDCKELIKGKLLTPSRLKPCSDS